MSVVISTTDESENDAMPKQAEVLLADQSCLVNHCLVPRLGMCQLDPVHTFVGFSAPFFRSTRRVELTVPVPDYPASGSGLCGRHRA